MSPAIGRKALYIDVSDAEHTRLLAIAARDGLSLSQWIRDSINNTLAESGDDALLLALPKRMQPGYRRPHFGKAR